MKPPRNMTLNQATALAERAATATRRAEFAAEARPTPVNLARLKRAQATERAAWARAQAVSDRDELLSPADS